MHVGKILYVTLSMKTVCITKAFSMRYTVILQKIQTCLVEKKLPDQTLTELLLFPESMIWRAWRKF